jgi:hypothetical protein
VLNTFVIQGTLSNACINKAENVRQRGIESNAWPNVTPCSKCRYDSRSNRWWYGRDV